jgi:hypothetical protein
MTQRGMTTTRSAGVRQKTWSYDPRLSPPAWLKRYA